MNNIDNGINGKAIIVGIIVTILISCIALIPIFCNTWNENNIWQLIVSISIIAVVAYFAGGLVAGIIAKHRGARHGFIVAVVVIIISVAINLLFEGVDAIYGIGTAFVIASSISALGGFIGTKVIKNKSNYSVDVKCPLCGRDTTIRTVIKGRSRGKRFYVCSNYPQCTGKIKV